MNGFNHGRPAQITHAPTPWLPRRGRSRATIACIGCTVLMAGCIERTITINTEPDEAIVSLNDEEVGRSPVQVPFTWYGDYDIIVRKEGYKTLQTHHYIAAPWYQLPGIDIITECLVPITVHDDRVLDTLVLEPAEPPTKEALLEAAADMRRRAESDAD